MDAVRVRCNLCDSPPEDHEALLTAPFHRAARPYFGGATTTRFVICRRCSLVFLSPRPPEPFFLDFYRSGNRSGTDREAILAGEKANEAFYRRTIGFLREHVTVSPDPVVCDVGCGYGTLLAGLEEALGARGVGLELSDGAADFAESEYGLEVRRTTVDGVGGDDRFDLATCIAVVEHMFDPAGSLATLAAHIRDGGHLYIVVPEIERIRLRPLRGERLQSVFKIMHLYYFSSATLQALVECLGFEVVAAGRHARNTRQGEIWVLARKTGEAPRGGPPPGAWKSVRGYVRRQTRAARLFAHLQRAAFSVLGDRLVRSAHRRIARRR